jgi:hypothetical protein
VFLVNDAAQEWLSYEDWDFDNNESRQHTACLDPTAVPPCRCLKIMVTESWLLATSPLCSLEMRWSTKAVTLYMERSFGLEVVACSPGIFNLISPIAIQP